MKELYDQEHSDNSTWLIMSSLFKILTSVGILIISCYPRLHAEQMWGRVIVFNADTFEMHDTRSRLQGMDVRESG